MHVHKNVFWLIWSLKCACLLYFLTPFLYLRDIHTPKRCTASLCACTSVQRLCEGEHTEESEARYKNPEKNFLKKKATTNHLKRQARVYLKILFIESTKDDDDDDDDERSKWINDLLYDKINIYRIRHKPVVCYVGNFLRININASRFIFYVFNGWKNLKIKRQVYIPSLFITSIHHNPQNDPSFVGFNAKWRRMNNEKQIELLWSWY